VRGKPASPVLRGRGRSNALPLPDRLSHDPLGTSARFGDLNLVSRAGLVPVMSLAERAGLFVLVRDHVRVGGPRGANAGPRSVPGRGRRRRGRTVSMTWTCRATARWASCSPACGRRPLWDPSCDRSQGQRAAARQGEPAADVHRLHSTQRRVYGHVNQGAAFGHTKIQGKRVLVRGLKRAGRHGDHPACGGADHLPSTDRAGASWARAKLVLAASSMPGGANARRRASD